MATSLSGLQVLGLVLAGIVGGAALLTLLLGWLAGISGDDAGAGCLGIGAFLLMLAGLLAVRVLTSA